MEKKTVKSNVDNIITALAKSLNGDNVNVNDCIYKGKKKFIQEIKIK